LRNIKNRKRPRSARALGKLHPIAEKAKTANILPTVSEESLGKDSSEIRVCLDMQ